jgi:hypothetical protein
MSDGPLAGITVVELAEGIAGPFGGQMLADFGARVIKVEPPGATGRARSRSPLAGARSFVGCNRAKESVSVDLCSEAGPEIVPICSRSTHGSSTARSLVTATAARSANGRGATRSCRRTPA